MRKKVPEITTVLIALNLIIFFLAELVSGSTEDTRVLVKWGAGSVPLIKSGEYWRLLTSMFLHAGIRHLLNNMLILFVMGQHLEFLLGRVKFLILYLAGGLIAAFVSYHFYLARGELTVFVGASGAIFAVIGALVWIIIRNKGHADGLTLRQMMVMLAFSLYFGLVASNVSNIAHISGLVAGFALSVLLYRKRQTFISDGINGTNEIDGINRF